MSFFGKKGGKGKRGQPQAAVEYKFDLSAPDSFTEENLAKMSGVDTMAFDENDPTLMAELVELGWGEEDGAGVASVPSGHRPRPDAQLPGRGEKGPGDEGASPAPAQERGGNDMLRSLGLSLNSMGDAELTEQDLQDPDLLRELGEVSGDLDFGKDDNAGGMLAGVKRAGESAHAQADEEEAEPDRAEEGPLSNKRTEKELPGTLPDDALEALLEDDALGYEAPEKPVRAAAPTLPKHKPPAAAAPRGSSSSSSSDNATTNNEIIQLEAKAERFRRRAVDLNKAGDRQGALAALRAESALKQELHVLHALETAQQVASVTTEYVEAPAPSPAGAGAGAAAAAAGSSGGSGGKPVSAEKLMAQVKVLYQRAVELKKENRMAEAMNCLKRAKSLEADLLRDALDKGLVAPGEEVDLMGTDGRRPSYTRQASNRFGSAGGKGGDKTGVARAGEGGKGTGAGAKESVQTDGRRKERRSGSSRAELPASVKASIQPKAFPAERDLFSDLEDALAAAIQLHQDKARVLLKKDRAAATKEVKRYKELQGKLDLTHGMRVVPGARPPPWQWKIIKKSRIRVVQDVAMDQMELEIVRVHGLADKTNYKGSFWIKFDLGYSKDDKIGKGVTQSYRCESDTVEVGFKALNYVKRARSMQMACQNRRAVLEIMHKSSIFSREKMIGKCFVPLQPLLTHCELAASSPILGEGRREAGGSIELTLRLRKPISADELIVTEEKELEVGEWPPVLSDPIPSSTPTTAAVAAPTASASSAAPAAPAAKTMAAGAATIAAEFQGVKLTDTEKTDPFAVENLDSNNILEAEIEAVAAKAARGDLAAVTRKGALETKLMMLVSAVQSGELDLPAYCTILKERIVRDKVLALHLKGEKRTKEAVAVMKRIRAMEAELAGVPEDQQGEEVGEQ